MAACASRTDLAACLAAHLAGAFPKAQRVLVLLRDEHTGALRPAASQPPGAQTVNELFALRSLAEGRALLWRESLDGLDTWGRRHGAGAGGLCAPIFLRHQPLGVLCVESDDSHDAFSATDLPAMLGIAALAALSLR
jgi:GAF domain-containing protein